MGAIVRIVFPLIAYLCVATVITVVGGYGYLRYSERLDNEQMFQILSVLHGIDLEEIEESQQENQADVPLEDASYEQQQELIQLAILNRQGKRDDLKNLIDEFDTKFKKLKAASGHYDSFKKEVELYLKQRKADAIGSGILTVRSHLQNLNPRKQAKPLLIRMIEDGKMDDVILLLNGMSKGNRTDILSSFATEEELKIIYDIEDRMLRGDPERSYIDAKLQELNEGNQQDK